VSANQLSSDTVTDMESRLREDDHHSIRLWLRLLTCSSMLEKQLRDLLREEFGTTLPRFDFMAQLHRKPDGLMMGELSELMMVSGGNVSTISAQLIKENLIVKKNLPTDRRAFVVKLTAKGKRVFEKMATRHEEWIVGLLSELDIKEIDELTKRLGTFKQAISNTARNKKDL
jgi:DNA-binding MarR family transcriptional regulator